MTNEKRKINFFFTLRTNWLFAALRFLQIQVNCEREPECKKR
jgi:hypothetical protein